MAKGNAKFYGGGGETDDQHAFRDLIVSANIMSSFDLTPAVRFSFGLSSAFTPARGGKLEIETDGILDGVMLYDVMQQPKRLLLAL
jgi:hypothetical protein